MRLPIFLSARGVTPLQKGPQKRGYSAIISCAFSINQQPLSYDLILKQKKYNQPFRSSVRDKSSLVKLTHHRSPF